MTDLAAAELPAVGKETPAPLPSPAPPPRRSNPLLEGPILPTLLRLATPNAVALTAGTCVVIAETSYIGRLGTEPLAAMALVFPFVMLTMTMSGGAMGGGVASAIARALGADDQRRAAMLASHALLNGLGFGLVFTIGMLAAGPYLLQQLGGRGRVLSDAGSYITIFFGGACIPWLMNSLAAILRGTGNMRLPSAMILLASIAQIVFGGILGLGLGPIPQFGMPGVATGTLIAMSLAVVVMGWHIFSGRARVRPILRGFKLHRGMFFDILSVGLISCFSPLQSVLTVAIMTHMLAPFGNDVLAGYGIGVRLEFMLITAAYAIGAASVPMVGMAIGAGLVRRARRIAWTGGITAFLLVGIIGTLIAASPDLWIHMFTDDPGVVQSGQSYLAIAGPLYGFMGLAMSIYFSSQGAAKMIGPVIAQTARLVFVAAGGAWLVAHDAKASSFFWLAGLSMVVLGVLCTLAVWLTRWGPREAA